MIIQACINGARPAGFHKRLPLTPEAMIRDSRECLEAGAAELHIHPRDTNGRESLAAVSELISAIRQSCPGTLVGVSTGAWIEGNHDKTRACIAGWATMPDYASVNLSEPDAPAILSILARKGIGIEAGLATIEDAKRFVGLPGCDRVFRVLIEIDEQRLDEACRIADGIEAILNSAGIKRPVLVHGFDATVWHFVRRALHWRFSTRVGLEDGCQLPDGRVAGSNAELVAAAAEIFRRSLL